MRQQCAGGRGCAPDPARGAHDAPPDPLVGRGGGHGKSSESVQCAVLKACDACADMGQL